MNLVIKITYKYNSFKQMDRKIAKYYIHIKKKLIKNTNKYGPFVKMNAAKN
jgi:hypothetical protein